MKFGFVYIWFDRKHKRYYIGSHWGTPDDGYICSSRWMRKSYKRRPEDFKRRIIAKVLTTRADLLIEEDRWLKMMKPEELAAAHSKESERGNIRYYNHNAKAWECWHATEERRLTVGEKISLAKKGKKTGPRDPEIGRKISDAKRRSFEKRRVETGFNYAPDVVDSWKNNGGISVTPESNAKRSESLKLAHAEGRHRKRKS